MREHRLTRRTEFTAVYGAGRRFYSKNFIVFVLRRETLNAGEGDAPRPRNAAGETPSRGGPDAWPEAWRMGLAVTRKTGSAVVRNRVKRVLREFFRLHGNMLPPGMDIVVTPKRTLDPGCVTLSFVERELAPVLLQAARVSGQGNSRL